MKFTNVKNIKKWSKIPAEAKNAIRCHASDPLFKYGEFFYYEDDPKALYVEFYTTGENGSRLIYEIISFEIPGAKNYLKRN